METILQRRAFWLAAILTVAGAFFLTACDDDSPPSAPGISGCTQLGGACGANTTCCGGLSCLQGICDAQVRCAGVGSRCNGSRPCCGTATCRGTESGGICDDGSCMGRGRGCGPGVTCCGTLTCQGGICN